MKSRLTVLIGLPRAGKSTWARDYKTSEVVISADEFRQLMYGQRYYAEGKAMMWATRDISLKILMQQGVNIIIDETNTTVQARAKLLKLATKYDYYAEAIWIDATQYMCRVRAAQADQKDLIPIIEKMSDQLEPPEYSEGFGDICYVGKDPDLREKYSPLGESR